MSLETNRRYFEECIKILNNLLINKNYDDAASYAQKISTHAWLNFTGYFSNFRLEKILVEIGGQVKKIEKFERPRNRKILHVCSELNSIGGHTKLLFNWIENDVENDHYIVLTRQNNINCLKEKFNSYYKKIIILNSEKILDKAFELKKIAKDYEHIILHIHPDDVIPIIAFSDESFITPILFNNHADHIFWLGNSVIDLLIQIRENNIKEDAKRRQIINSYYLPIIIDSKKIHYHQEILKKEKDKIYLLTTGQEYKYTPTEKHNFFLSIIKILEKHKNAILLFVGIDKNSSFAKKYGHERIHFLGRIENIELYEDFCDIYLEGFPISSFTALLQPAVKGKYVHLMYDPPKSIRLFSEKYKEYFNYPVDENEWFKNLSQAIENKNFREKNARKQNEFLLSEYSVQSWQNKLSLIYQSSTKLSHIVNKKVKKDLFFDSEDEKMLANKISYKINHFEFSNKLNKINKIKNIFIYYRFNKNLIKYRLKEILAYLLK